MLADIPELSAVGTRVRRSKLHVPNNTSSHRSYDIPDRHQVPMPQKVGATMPSVMQLDDNCNTCG